MNNACVLMSTYNGEKYLQQQIDSIMNQKDVKMHLLIRDDGSTDGTIKILNDYQSKGILKWYTGENLKPAYSFWDLIENAEEIDYYAFADQDDYWYPNKISSAIERIMQHSAEKPILYFCKKRIVDEKLHPLNVEDENVPYIDITRNLVTCRAAGCTMVFNKELLNKLRKYKPEVMTMHDSWILRVATVAGYVIYDERIFMDYRQHSENVVGVTENKYKIWIKRFKSIFKRRKDDARSKMAMQLYTHYFEYMSNEDRLITKSVGSIRTSFKARLVVIKNGFLKSYNSKEDFFVKLFVLFGWF